MPAVARRSSGTTVWIGTTAANPATDTYTEIKNTRIVGGSIGGAWQMADSTAISDVYKQAAKTIIDPGDVDLDINEVSGDPGLVALEAAYNDTNDVDINFEVRFVQGDKARFRAKVAQFLRQPGQATSLRNVKAKAMLTGAVTMA